jgi:hypothetical protein
MQWKGTLIPWEYKLVQPLWNSLWRFFIKLKVESPYNPAVTLLGTYAKECKSVYNNDT